MVAVMLRGSHRATGRMRSPVRYILRRGGGRRRGKRAAGGMRRHRSSSMHLRRGGTRYSRIHDRGRSMMRRGIVPRPAFNGLRTPAVGQTRGSPIHRQSRLRQPVCALMLRRTVLCLRGVPHIGRGAQSRLHPMILMPRRAPGCMVHRRPLCGGFPMPGHPCRGSVLRQHLVRFFMNGRIQAAGGAHSRAMAVREVRRHTHTMDVVRIMPVAMVPRCRAPQRHRAGNRQRTERKHRHTRRRVTVHRAAAVIAENRETGSIVAGRRPHGGIVVIRAAVRRHLVHTRAQQEAATADCKQKCRTDMIQFHRCLGGGKIKNLWGTSRQLSRCLSFGKRSCGIFLFKNINFFPKKATFFLIAVAIRRKKSPLNVVLLDVSCESCKIAPRFNSKR